MAFKDGQLPAVMKKAIVTLKVNQVISKTVNGYPVLDGLMETGTR